MVKEQTAELSRTNRELKKAFNKVNEVNKQIMESLQYEVNTFTVIRLLQFIAKLLERL